MAKQETIYSVDAYRTLYGRPVGHFHWRTGWALFWALVAIIVCLAVTFTDSSLALLNAPVFVQLPTCDFYFASQFVSNRCDYKIGLGFFYGFIGVMWYILDGTRGAYRYRMRVVPPTAWNDSDKLGFLFADGVYNLWTLAYWFMFVLAIQDANMAFILSLLGGWALGWLLLTMGLLWWPRTWRVPVDDEYAPIHDGSSVNLP